MSTLEKAIAASICIAWLGACKSTSPSTSSAVKDSAIGPAETLPAAVTILSQKTPDQLDAIFTAGTIDTSTLPTGYAVGTHVLPPDAKAQVPLTLVEVTQHLWKGKIFDGNSGIMTDQTLGPNLNVRAALRLLPMQTVLTQYGLAGLDPRATVDSNVSLITDYRQIQYQGIEQIAAAAQGWIDELRQVDPNDPNVYLGRSTYNGYFWGFVILYMKDSPQ